MEFTDTYALLQEAQRILGLSQGAFGEAAGSSKRTGQRWATRRATPSPDHLRAVARLVYPLDPELAERIAFNALSSLEALGLRQPPPDIPTPGTSLQLSLSPRQAADCLVCAAADAAGRPPGDLRAPLLAAFVRAAELGLSLETVVRGLSEGEAERRSSTPQHPSAV